MLVSYNLGERYKYWLCSTIITPLWRVDNSEIKDTLEVSDAENAEKNILPSRYMLVNLVLGR